MMSARPRTFLLCTQTLQPTLKDCSCRSKAPISCVQLPVERLRRFGNRDGFDVHHEKNGAFVLAQSFERSFEKPRRLALGEELGGPERVGGDVVPKLVVRRGLHARLSAPPRPSFVLRHPYDDSDEPRLGRRSACVE